MYRREWHGKLDNDIRKIEQKYMKMPWPLDALKKALTDLKFKVKNPPKHDLGSWIMFSKDNSCKCCSKADRPCSNGGGGERLQLWLAADSSLSFNVSIFAKEGNNIARVYRTATATTWDGLPADIKKLLNEEYEEQLAEPIVQLPVPGWAKESGTREDYYYKSEARNALMRYMSEASKYAAENLY